MREIKQKNLDFHRNIFVQIILLSPEKQYETTWMRFSALTFFALGINKCSRHLDFILAVEKDIKIQVEHILEMASDTKHLREKSELHLAAVK